MPLFTKFPRFTPANRHSIAELEREKAIDRARLTRYLANADSDPVLRSAERDSNRIRDWENDE